MKKMLTLLAVIFMAKASAQATPYFRLMDVHHVQTDAITLFAVNDSRFVGAVTDVALITHVNADGSLIPQKLQDIGLIPEPWVPLQVGLGGDIHTNALIHMGSSVNVSAFVAGSAIKICGGIKNPTAKAIADFMTTGLDLGQEYGVVGFSAGIGVAGNIVNNGHFQSAKAMFPGQGIGEILKNASTYSLGLAWKL